MDDTRSHVRLASKALGDDVTFSRYVKLPNRGVRRGKPHSPRLPGLELPAMIEGRTFFRKSVRDPDDLRQLLVSGHSNVKIGRDVRVGRLKGYWLYTLSLEERATCPRTCHHWQSCYGNSMPYAKRVNHRRAGFLPKLRAEIDALMAAPSPSDKRRQRKGVIIRLHALGDFYDVDYVRFWEAMLVRHPKLVVFGYTAWNTEHPIAREVSRLIDLFPGRAMIRFSNGGLPTRSTVPIVDAESCPPGAFVCPEQTGQFEACGKCGACWSTLKNVAFIAH